MQKMGLSAREHAAYERALANDHEMRVRVNVLNMDGQFRHGLTPRLLDGQVNVDAGGQRTTRVAQLQLLDPDRTLHFDPDAPSELSLYRNRKIRVFYDVLVNEMDIGWVEVPVANGPCTSFSRNGSIVDVEVSGKDYDYATRHTWIPLELKKGIQVTEAIKRILRERCGETHFAIPDLKGAKYRLPKDRTLRRLSHPWLVAKRLARSIDRQLYFDGAGVCRMRRLPHGKPLFVFRDGDGGLVASDPQRSFTDDPDRFANGVWATGRKLPGAKKPLETKVWAPFGHSLSPHQLGTGDVPFRKVAASHNPGFRTADGIEEWALRRLHELLEGSVDTAWESYAVPHLDPGDRVAVRTDEFHAGLNLWRFSIPLTPGGRMSCGFTRKIAYGPSRGGRVWTRHPIQVASMGQSWGYPGDLPGSMGQSWEQTSA